MDMNMEQTFIIPLEVNDKQKRVNPAVGSK